MAFSATGLAAALDALDPDWRGARHCIAYSGGLDSAVLLHAMASLARASGMLLRAVHVDHGLQPGSAEWSDACADACRRLGVPFSAIALGLVPAPGQSIEAQARTARYAAIAGALGDGERLLTAHQRDDQLETVLIQLLRGAGPAGLAAMPGRAALGRGWQLRPLLGFDRAALADYARREGLAWHEDPMNADPRFDRAYLRQRILPALRERWPAASATVARSSRHIAEVARLAAALAALDAADALDAGRLSVAGLASLAPERRTNLLRWWLHEQGFPPPPAARLERGLHDLLGARADGAPRLAWDGGEIRRHRGWLYAIAALAPAVAPQAREDGSWDLGAGLGRFELVAGAGGGLCAERAKASVVRFRSGGETIRPHADRPRRRLKDLCREAGIVPWMRERLPLVFAGDRLAAVGDLWIDADFAAGAGRPALVPVWSGRPALY